MKRSVIVVLMIALLSACGGSGYYRSMSRGEANMVFLRSCVASGADQDRCMCVLTTAMEQTGKDKVRAALDEFRDNGTGPIDDAFDNCD